MIFQNKRTIHEHCQLATKNLQQTEREMEFAQEPKPGDLIQIFRRNYQHWAIYVGDGYVVHLAPPSEVAGAGVGSLRSVTTNVAHVKKEKLWKVIGDCRWKINNLMDDEYEPHPVNIILSNANQLVGSELPYCIMKGNCEHFVTQLRYGKAKSRQVRKVAMGVLVPLALAGAYLSHKEDKRKQHPQREGRLRFIQKLTSQALDAILTNTP
ncbi:phospholipase A and acyltransferase 4-like isoform X2 [Stigmatopora argus]